MTGQRLRAAAAEMRRRLARRLAPELEHDRLRHRKAIARLAQTLYDGEGGGRVRVLRAGEMRIGWTEPSLVVDKAIRMLAGEREPGERSLVEILAEDLFDNRLGWGDDHQPYAPRAFWGALGLALGRDLGWLQDTEPTLEFPTTREAAMQLVAEAERKVRA